MTDTAPPPDREESTTALWRTALALLGEREGAVLSLRHGAFGGERLSFGDIGRELGISRQRTHQIYEVALEKLVQNEELRGLVQQLATAAPRGVAEAAAAAPAAAEQPRVSEVPTATAVEAPSPARESAPEAKKAPAAVKPAGKKASKASAASSAPRVERRAGSVVVQPQAPRASAPAGLETLIAQLEGLQKFHAGVESRVRELLAYIEREMPR